MVRPLRFREANRFFSFGRFDLLGRNNTKGFLIFKDPLGQVARGLPLFYFLPQFVGKRPWPTAYFFAG